MNPLLLLVARHVQRFLRTIDLALLVPLVGLMIFGLVTLFSAGDHSTRMVISQGSRFVIGLGLMWIFSRMTPPFLRSIAPHLYVLTLLPLVVSRLQADFVLRQGGWFGIAVCGGVGDPVAHQLSIRLSPPEKWGVVGTRLR